VASKLGVKAQGQNGADTKRSPAPAQRVSRDLKHVDPAWKNPRNLYISRHSATGSAEIRHPIFHALDTILDIVSTFTRHFIDILSTAARPGLDIVRSWGSLVSATSDSRTSRCSLFVQKGSKCKGVAKPDHERGNPISN
jgi:hypothetical protein